jgi:hypothetical protein
MFFGKHEIFYIYIAIFFCLSIMSKHSYCQLMLEQKSKTNSNQITDAFLMRVLSFLELKLKNSLFDEGDMLVLIHLGRIINEKFKYLNVDYRPDFWYLRQG